MSAIVLGAGPGLGMALARAYGQTGRPVAIVARRREAVEVYAASLTGVDALGLTADLGDPEAVASVIREAADRLGAPDIVHYNASTMVQGTPSQVPLAGVEQAWRVGCLGAWAALQASVPVMPTGSAFFVTGGGLALDPWPSASALAAAKAALRSLVHSAAKELTDIRVAMITVSGLIAQDTALSPDEIARHFLGLLEQTHPAVETVLPSA